MIFDAPVVSTVGEANGHFESQIGTYSPYANGFNTRLRCSIGLVRHDPFYPSRLGIDKEAVP